MKVGKSENQHSEEIKLFDYFLYINFTFSCEATTAIRLISEKKILKQEATFIDIPLRPPFIESYKNVFLLELSKMG